MATYKDLKNNKFATDTTDTSNFVDTGTEGTKVATGTTAQRGSTAGQLRYNTTTDRFEGKNASGVTEIFASPSVTSVDDTEVDSGAGGNQTFVITGSNFATGDVASFVSNNGTTITASSTTVNSATQITAVIAKSSFVNAQEPYDIKITSGTNQIGTLENIINVDNPVTWTTASGSLGTINDDVTGTHFTLVANDPDGDAITFSEVGTNLSASGVSLSSAGVLSGDPTDQSVGASTTYSFTVRATANGKTADRSLSFIVSNPAPFIVATGGTISYDGDYKIHTFPYSTTADTDIATNFVISFLGSDSTYGNKIWYLLVGGGGSNAAHGNDTTGLGLTAFGGGKSSAGNSALGNGGSGGGGQGDSSSAGNSYGLGTAGQGNNGGVGYDPNPEGSGGGGGAGGAGSAGRSQGNSSGGVGKQNSITGTSTYYAGGGGGGNYYSCGQASGGNGGGGLGRTTGACTDIAGTAGTNGLGGGAGATSGFGGGGGAGGLLTNGATSIYNFTVTQTTYSIVVGGGAESSGTYTATGGAGTGIIRYKYQ